MRSAAIALFLLAISLAPPALAQQQTGSLTLTVTDASGKPLSGADVTIGSDRSASQFRTADASGKVRFLLLPPGLYVADVGADGYMAVRRDVQVLLGQDTVQEVALAQGELTETVTVVASPEVDVTQTSTSRVYSSEELQNTMIGSANRSYLSAVGHTAGVAGGGGNPSVHGATIGENVYLIDGVNTTDPVTGTFGLLTNFDAIDQLEVSTGGFQAEYGWATGGYINQVTKSGTNDWDGALDLRWYDDGLIADTPNFAGDLAQEYHQYAFTIGGPIVEDKAWFFGGIEDNLTRIGVANAPVVREFTGQSWIGKFTFQPRPNHRISFQYSADPAEISNDNASELVRTEAGNFQKQGANFYKLTYWGAFGDHWALSAQLGWYRSVLDTYPLDDSGLPSIRDARTNTLFQNYDDAQFTDRSNNQLSVSAERAFTAGRSDHDVKFGFDLQHTQLDASRNAPGGERWTTVGRDDPNTPENENGDPTVLWTDENGDTYPDNLAQIEQVNSVGTSTNEGAMLALYVQDTWRRGRATFDYGLRWDMTSADRDDKQTIVDAALLQPRLGVAYDVKDDGKQKLYGSLTRRAHPGILAVASVANQHNNTSDYYIDETWARFDCDGDEVLTPGLTYCGSTGGPSSSNVDPDLKAAYLDEAIAGYQWQFKPKQDFGARIVVNRTREIIEDTIDDPDAGTYVITNLSGLKRSYEGVELEYGWRFKRGEVRANWTISRARGNVEYTQGIGTDFDILPIHGVNRYGYLSTDRRHRIKVFGWVDLPRKFRVAYDVFFGTGVPFERVRNVESPEQTGGLQPYGVEYLDPRGSHRLPSLLTVDADLRRTFDFGAKDRIKLMLIGSVHNLFNANSVTARQELDPQPLHPAPGDPPVDTDWGNALAWQDPRSVELGLRLEF